MEPARSTIRVYEDLIALGEIVPAWDDLLGACPEASIFSTWEWLGSWWEAFGSAQRLHVVAFWNAEGTLQALAPLAISTRPIALGMRLSVLQLMGDGSGDSDNLGLLVRPGFEVEFAERLLNHLDDQTVRWDLAQFNTMDPTAPWIGPWRHALSRYRWPVVASPRPWSVIQLPSTWPGYLRDLSSKERGKIGTRLRRLERRYQVSFQQCTDENELSESLETLFRLHAKRWQVRKQGGSFDVPQRRQFYKAMGTRFLLRKWLDFSQLTLDGKPVAAQFAFRFRDAEYSLQEGYDPDYSTDAVGYVLRSCNLRRLIGDGVRRYDFLAGHDASKARWGVDLADYVDVHFARRRSMGAAQIAAARAKSWLRRHQR